MRDIIMVIELLGGLALFLYGMRIMGDGLRSSSSGALKKALEKVTNNTFYAFLLGLVVTCIIQSSTATVVLAVGLVSAGMLTFRQSIGIVIGANVGTTITGQIIRLLDISDTSSVFLQFLKPSTLAPLAAIIGVILIVFIKSRATESIGTIAMGFGILFTGLLNMSASVSPLAESPAFLEFLQTITVNPILGFLTGFLVTGVVKSSSAVVGILQTMCSTGALTFSAVYAVIIGINMGDCVTTWLVCRLDAKRDGVRTSVVHVLFNLFGSVIIIAGIIIGKTTGLLDNLWNMHMMSGDVANVHTFFKLSEALLLLPFTSVFQKLACRLVKGGVSESSDISAELSHLDEKLYMSPNLALAGVSEVIGCMCRLATLNVRRAESLFYEYKKDVRDSIDEDEDNIDHLADAVDNYLVKMSSHIETKSSSDQLNYYIQCFAEFERVGDLAVNLSENASDLDEKQVAFSQKAKDELSVLGSAIQEILTLSARSFNEKDCVSARRIEPLEEVIDDLVGNLKGRHIERLRNGSCSVIPGTTFLDALTNFERIADQCSNIAIYTLAIHDTKMLQNQHDYIRELHTGDDEFYHEEFDRRYAQYFDALAPKA